MVGSSSSSSGQSSSSGSYTIPGSSSSQSRQRGMAGPPHPPSPSRRSMRGRLAGSRPRSYRGDVRCASCVQDRKEIRMPGAPLACLAIISLLFAGPDENDVYILTEPEHTLEEVARAYTDMPPVRYHPPADRWANLPVTASELGRGGGTL